jgi:uncharacterized protein (PEP-CTERM system associated)
VTAITPGISIDGKGARTSLRLSYTLTGQFYSPGYSNSDTDRLLGQKSASNSHQNALTAVGMLEAIEDWLFIDATGTISQQYLSAFGTVSPMAMPMSTTTRLKHQVTRSLRTSKVDCFLRPSIS